MIDRTWTEYEGQLHTAIADLVNGQVDARTWIRVLVPFVACMLVRGPDFDKRYERRMRALGLDPEGGHLSADNTNGVRLFELQRLLGPVAVAKWIVIRVEGEAKLINNDLGYAPFVNPGRGEAGIAIPLDLAHVLAVIPRTEGRVVLVRSDEWAPAIEHVSNPPDDHEGLNRALASIAQRFIFGSDEATVTRWLEDAIGSVMPPEPEQLGFITDPLARAHEFTWHRLAAAIELAPDEDIPWDFPLDWNLVAQGWAPPVFFAVNLVEFPPALQRAEDGIYANFYDPSLYYALSAIRNLEQVGAYDELFEEATRALDLEADDSQKVLFLIARGGALDELKRYDEALQDYDEAFGLESKSVEALTNRAATYLKLRDYDSAEEDLNKALGLDPEFGVARLNLGTLLYMRNDYASAIREITEALDRLPRGPATGAAHLSRGNAYLMNREYEEATNDFSIASNEYPDSRAKAFCEFRRAVALGGSGDNKAALRAINLSLDQNSESADAHVFKAQQLLEIEDAKGAIDELTAAINLGEGLSFESGAFDLRAKARSSLGFYSLALEDHQRALQLESASSTLHHNYGMT
ncbi:MAG: tetratricopeptide repeat protein, partial [Anaerolineales bacterium]